MQVSDYRKGKQVSDYQMATHRSDQLHLSALEACTASLLQHSPQLATGRQTVILHQHPLDLSALEARTV